MWNIATRNIGGRPSGFVVRDERDQVICIIPKNAPRTQAECERLAREIAGAHNGR